MEKKEVNGPLASPSFVPLSNNLALEPLRHGHHAWGGGGGHRSPEQRSAPELGEEGWPGPRWQSSSGVK